MPMRVQSAQRDIATAGVRGHRDHQPRGPIHTAVYGSSARPHRRQRTQIRNHRGAPAAPAPGFLATPNTARLLPPGCIPARTTATMDSVANHRLWLTCQIRTCGRGYPSGVALLLLDPSASPGRVWLYAAELNERPLAPNISTPIRCIRHSMRISLVLAWPGIVGPPTVCPPVHRRTRRSAGATPNRPRAKLNDAFDRAIRPQSIRTRN
jgi:hypothetical protein